MCDAYVIETRLEGRWITIGEFNEEREARRYARDYARATRTTVDLYRDDYLLGAYDGQGEWSPV